MSYRKRPSDCSVFSNASSSSSASTTSSASSSVYQPSPLAFVSESSCPDIVEDEDGEDDGDNAPNIFIGEEQIDESPFDPSIPDEVYVRMMNMRSPVQNDAAEAPPARNLRTSLSRIVSNSSTRNTIPQSPGRTSSWRSRFKFKRQDSVEQEDSQDAVLLGHQKRDYVPEPGVVISSRHPASMRWNLIPLDTAQTRSEISRRPEGFEMAESRGKVQG